MALLPLLAAPTQSADLTTLTITDASGAYSAGNPGGWGSPNTNLGEINGMTSDLRCQITYTSPSGTIITYGTLHFYAFRGHAPVNLADIFFAVTLANLQIGGVTAGAATDPLPDGWYDIVYSVDHDLAGGTGSPSTFTMSILIDGQVRQTLYNAYVALPERYTSVSDLPTEIEQAEINLLDYCRSLLFDKDLFPTQANKQRMLTILQRLQNLMNMVTVIGTPFTSAPLGWSPVYIGSAPKYLYIAYADDNIGTGFSLVSGSKAYMALLTSAIYYTSAQLNASLFAGLWYNRSSSTFTGVRADTITATAGTNVVTFNSPMSSTDYVLTLYETEGIGVSVTPGSETINGFTVEALDACTFKYIAMIKS